MSRFLLIFILTCASVCGFSQNNKQKVKTPTDTVKGPDTSQIKKGIGNSSQKKASVLDTIMYYNYVCSNKMTICLVVKGAKNYTVNILHKNLQVKSTDQDKTNAFIDSSAFIITNSVNTDNIVSWLNTVDTGCTDEHKSVANQIHDKIEADQQLANTSKSKQIIDSLTSLLKDINRVAGALHFRNAHIPIYNKDKGTYTLVPNVFITVESVHVTTDYNRISDITLNGALLHESDKLMYLSVITNRNYSLGLASLNHQEFWQLVPFKDKNDITNKHYYFNYADLIRYEPYNNDFSSIVQNADYSLNSKDTLVKVLRRSYSDYLSFRTFLDPLGFLSNSPNGFAQLEGDAILPMRTTNHGIFNWIPQAHFNFNYIYSNSINNEPRIAIPIPFASPYVAVNKTKDSTAYYLHNLDVVKYAYYQFYGRFSVLALDLHRLSSWLHFELGTRVIGAKIYTSDTTKTSTALVHMIIPEVNIRMEIRPDYIIGSDFNIGIEYLEAGSLGNNNPNNVNNPSLLYKTSYAISHEINIYAKTSPDGTGGLFFRYIGWLAFDSKLSNGIEVNSTNKLINSEIKKTSYFPQILVGYSTNLNALIKKNSKTIN